MRNIFFLLITVLCLQACKEDNEEIWEADTLAIALSGDLISDGEAFSAGDGNWGVNIAPDSEGTLTLDIKTDQPWSLSVDNMTTEEEVWIIPSVKEGNGKAIVNVQIDANAIPEYRKASIVIVTQGKIPVYKKITVIQKNLGILRVDWNSSFLLTDNEMVFGPNERKNLVIGTYEAEGDEVAAYSSAAEDGWATLTVENGNIILNLSANNDTGNEFQEASLSLTNLNGGVNKQISIKQYSKETFIEKTNWNIAANNSNTLSQSGHGATLLIDGSSNTFWERQWNDSGEGGAGGQKLAKFPYEFVIDFGEALLMNTVDIFQRLDWHTGCIKKVQLEFSNDKSDWTNGGTYTLSQSKDECSGKKDAYVFSLQGAYEARYMKLIVLGNVWNSPQDAALAELNVYLK